MAPDDPDGPDDPDDPATLSDFDGDGVDDAHDLFPENPLEWADTDGDGIGDNSAAFPNDPTRSTDANNDGIEDSEQRLYVAMEVPTTTVCAHGGFVTSVGLDANADGVLQAGEIDASQDIYSCAPVTYAVGGTVSGLAGTTDALGLAEAGGGGVTLTTNGAFTFPRRLEQGSPYGIAVSSQPNTRFCEPTRSAPVSGTIGTSAITNLSITCYQHSQVSTFASVGTFGLDVDADDSVYVPAITDNRIIRVPQYGAPTTVAGTGDAGYENGPALSARFNAPVDAAFDAQGNLFIVDMLNRAIRKLATNGQVTTVAGVPSPSGSYIDGNNATARFMLPRAAAPDASGNVYVVDNYERLRKIDASGNVTTWNPGTLAFETNPSIPGGIHISDVATGGGSTAYVSVNSSSFNGVINVLASGATSFLTEFFVNDDIWDDLSAVAVDKSGSLYVADYQNAHFRLRRISPATVYNDGSASNQVVTLLDSGSPGFAEGVGANARLQNGAGGLGVDSHGHVFVADANNVRVRRVHVIPSAIPPPTPPSYVPSANNEYQLGEELLTAFNNDPVAVAFLARLKASWNVAKYGSVPADGAIIDFAWEHCKTNAACSTTGDAMEDLTLLTREDGLYFVILAAWSSLRGNAGWGGAFDTTRPTAVCSGSLAAGNPSKQSGSPL